ncbi:FAD-dependent oxidoreductase, partial [Glutamicibacter creatinolyticus]|uniref:FAD-dependent oxidoreductase n=1 Tax=Glutamicibacter creatinolyticus TaxID=162496 RepID=UPI003B97EEC3
MTQHQVDLAIIGAGSGNTLLTDYWDDKQVAIAEKGPFGGTCLNVGCIPTKMFVRPAELARTPVEAQRLSVSLPEGSADWPAIRDRIFSRIDPIAQNGYEYRDQSPNVHVIAEEVTLDGTHGFRTAQGTSISAEQLVIAAGSRAVIPDIEGCDLPGVHTSDTVMRLERLPERIVIVGGGFIACEFAAIFSGLGSRTTQLIRRQHLMRHMDTEIRDAFNAEAPKYWNVERNTETQRITKNADGTLEVHTSAGTHTADIVLVATGRKPNTDLIGAQQAGLDLHQDGRLVVDEYQRVLR